MNHSEGKYHASPLWTLIGLEDGPRARVQKEQKSKLKQINADYVRNSTENYSTGTKSHIDECCLRSMVIKITCRLLEKSVG